MGVTRFEPAAGWSFACALVACGGPPAPPADAGLDDASAPPFEAPAMPAEPASPVLTPCPASWREITGDHATVCEPYPASGYDEGCALGDAHFAGAPGCMPIGAPCPADGWPTPTADRPMVYVDDDAAPGGDGASRASAFQTIAAAIAAAPSGAVVAIAAGLYDEALVLDREITLAGACAAQTRLTTRAPSTDLPTLRLGAGTGARDLAIERPERAGIDTVDASGIATLDGVLVTGALGPGILVRGGVLEATHLVVRGARADATRDGRGVDVRGTGRATLTHVVLDANATAGLFADERAGVTASDLVVRGTLAPASDEVLGGGVRVVGGASATLARAVVEGNSALGLGVGEGSELEASDLVVRGTTEPATAYANGVDVGRGAHLVLTRALVDANEGTGLLASGGDAVVQASDVIVRGTLPRPDGSSGFGLTIWFRARAMLARVAVEGSHSHGIWSTGDAVIEAFDLTIRDTLPTAAGGSEGQGLVVQGGSTATLLRALIDTSHTAGLTVWQEGSLVRATDLTVRGTRPRPTTQTGGHGIDVIEAGHLILERALVEGCRDGGVFLSDPGSDVEADDLTVRDILARASDETAGMGIWAQLGATLTARRVAVERTQLLGVAASGGAIVTLHELAVRGVTDSACWRGTCDGRSGGFGIYAGFGGRLDASDFSVEDASLCGVVVGEPDAFYGESGLDLRRGSIARSPVGACVPAVGYDTARLRDDVDYRDVAVPLQASSYALPDLL